MKKILLTGHKGFIGQNLIQRLWKDDYDVEGWELSDAGFPSINDKDLVIHLGAISDTTYSNLEHIMRVNLDFSVKLYNECIEQGVDMHFASSASVYGSLTSFSEDGPFDPKSFYAWTKYLFDRYVSENPTDKMIATGFRYFNVYGKMGEGHKGGMASPYHKFTEEAKNHGTVTLFENSYKYFRDFVSVEDVVEVHIKLINNKQSGIFNIGTGKATSFQIVGETIAKKYSSRVQYKEMPSALIRQYQTYTCADTKRLNKLIKMQWTNIIDYIG